MSAETTSDARLPFDLSELRTRTVRGVAINSAFLILVEVMSLAQGLIVARVLGPSEIGLYGIVSITVMTLIALKQVGIDEAYVQQDAQLVAIQAEARSQGVDARAPRTRGNGQIHGGQR